MHSKNPGRMLVGRSCTPACWRPPVPGTSNTKSTTIEPPKNLMFGSLPGVNAARVWPEVTTSNVNMSAFVKMAPVVEEVVLARLPTEGMINSCDTRRLELMLVVRLPRIQKLLFPIGTSSRESKMVVASAPRTMAIREYPYGPPTPMSISRVGQSDMKRGTVCTVWPSLAI